MASRPKIAESCMRSASRSPADVQVKNLSGDTHHRLVICMALLGNPKALLLDGRFTSQDVSTKCVLWCILRRFQSERAILLMMHSMEVEVLASHVPILAMPMLVSGMLRNVYGGSYSVRATYDVDMLTAVVDTCIRERSGGSISR